MNEFKELSEKEMDFIECELMNIKNNLSGRCVGSVVSQLIELCSTIEGHKSSADFVGELKKRFIYSKTTESTYRDLEGYDNLYRNDIKELVEYDKIMSTYMGLKIETPRIDLQEQMPEPAPMQVAMLEEVLPDFDDEVARIHRNALWNIVKKSAIVIGLFTLVIAFMTERLP